MEPKNNKNSFLVIGILVLFGVGIFFWQASVKKGEPEPVPIQNGEPTTVSSIENSKEKTGVKASAPTISVLSYSEALLKYRDFRIQFNETCQAVPNQMTFKNNTTIMLDNRSGSMRAIKVGTKSYSIKPYGFAIATVSSKELPLSFYVDCGTSQNVATILLQK